MEIKREKLNNFINNYMIMDTTWIIQTGTQIAKQWATVTVNNSGVIDLKVNHFELLSQIRNMWLSIVKWISREARASLWVSVLIIIIRNTITRRR